MITSQQKTHTLEEKDPTLPQKLQRLSDDDAITNSKTF